MRLRFLLFLFLFSEFSFAQDTLPIHYALQIKPNNLRSYLQVLASDSLEGRETGKAGQKKAANFIANHFKKQNLKAPVHGKYLQDTYLSLRANKGKNFEVNQMFFLYMKDYFYPPGQADTTISVDTMVFCGYGINHGDYNDYEDINVRNRAVIVYDGEPLNKKRLEKNNDSSWKNSWQEIIETAAEQKALLALIITDSIEQIAEDFNYSKATLPGKQLLFAFVSSEMALAFFPEINEERLTKAKNKIDSKGKPQSFISSAMDTLNFVKNTERLKGQNVLGYLEGTDKKDELLVITAHYDHLGKTDSSIYYGADDNGSGTSAIMELAKVFSKAKKEGHGPRRNILFMTVSGEEKGLLGSSFYVTHPIFPLTSTMTNLNIDMIGRTDSKHDSLGVRNYVYIIGSDKLSTALHKINETQNEQHTKLELDYTFNSPEDKNRFYYRSDHYNFAKNNIPIIFYFNGVHADYHKSLDTIDKIDFELLARRTQLVFFTAWELANREERITVDVKSDFENRKENNGKQEK
jgi:hypothetical protein